MAHHRLRPAVKLSGSGQLATSDVRSFDGLGQAQQLRGHQEPSCCPLASAPADQRRLSGHGGQAGHVATTVLTGIRFLR
jgi:hypothetical protein